MLKILANAYACCPRMGSEPGMGWNWVSSLARHCELHVITEEEFRPQIEEAVRWPEGQEQGTNAYGLTRGQCANLHFHWNPVAPEVRRMCWNQGDWRFYRHYRLWQERTARMARDICRATRIDILHQLNMIGFREPGYLWQVSRETGIPFVWGPIGGMKQFPLPYLQGAGLKMRLFMTLKNIINLAQIKFDRRVRQALRQACLLVASIPESQTALRKHHGRESVIIPETGCFPLHGAERPTEAAEAPLRLLWVGKYDFRKQLPTALRAVAQARASRPDCRVELQVCGTGNPRQVAEAQALVRDLRIGDAVRFRGQLSTPEVWALMRQCHLFFFTSISEDTSTVVLEAISNRLPVLCHNICGMAHVVDERVGCKVAVTNPQQSVQDFAEAILHFHDHREELARLSANCPQVAEELSWENKARQMARLYTEAIQKA